jgi:hypothetical protein
MDGGRNTRNARAPGGCAIDSKVPTSFLAAGRLAAKRTRERASPFAMYLAVAGSIDTGGAYAALAGAQSPMHPDATGHLPPFITSPGTTDTLMVLMAVVLVAAVLATGVLFFWLHSLPERLVHKSSKVHFDIVAVLGLLALFTHIHLFWVAALLIALVKIPDFSMPDFSSLFGRIATPLEKIADAADRKDGQSPSNVVQHPSKQKA